MACNSEFDFHNARALLSNNELNEDQLKIAWNFMFKHHGRGILILIRNNTPHIIPFINPNYENNWSNFIKLETSVYDLLNDVARKEGYIFRDKHHILPANKWRANNFLVRFDDKEPRQVDYIHNLLDETCANYNIPDSSFFFNSRDFPLLNSEYEPYESIWGNKTLIQNFPSVKIPVASMCKQDFNQDFLFPTSDDWNSVEINHVDWDQKIPVAIWRGSSTGKGICIRTNQRMKLCQLSNENPKILDAKITKWKCRARICEDKIIRALSPDLMLQGNYLSYDKQATYKYIVVIDGNVNAFRLGTLLSCGSVILLVNSDYKIWFTDKLVDGYHYISIKSDLSNLIEKIIWCQTHDAEAKIIAEAGKIFHTTHLSKKEQIKWCAQQLCLHAAGFGLNSSPVFFNIPASIDNFTLRWDIPRGYRYYLGSKCGPAQKHKSVAAAYEYYIARRTTNNIDACPNFAYIFGFSDNNVWVETNPDQTRLLDWISKKFNLNHLNLIIAQIYMTFSSAWCRYKFWVNSINLDNIWVYDTASEYIYRVGDVWYKIITPVSVLWRPGNSAFAFGVGPEYNATFFSEFVWKIGCRLLDTRKIYSKDWIKFMNIFGVDIKSQNGYVDRELFWRGQKKVFCDLESYKIIEKTDKPPIWPPICNISRAKNISRSRNISIFEFYNKLLSDVGTSNTQNNKSRFLHHPTKFSPEWWWFHDSLGIEF